MVERDGSAFGRPQGGDVTIEAIWGEVVLWVPWTGTAHEHVDPAAGGLVEESGLPRPLVTRHQPPRLPGHPLPSTGEPTKADVSQRLVGLLVGVEARAHPVQCRADREKKMLRDPEDGVGLEVETAPVVAVGLQRTHVPLQAHREDDCGLQALLPRGGL